jgi:hypothetical protein
VDQTPVPAGVKPCDWDPVTGLSRRLQPGRAGGMHTITGLAHGRDGQATRDPAVIEECRRARSLKLAALQQSLKAPTVFGAPSGDMLLIGWGSSHGRHRRSGDAAARRRPGRFGPAPAFHPAAGTGHARHPGALCAGDDDRGRWSAKPEDEMHGRGPAAPLGAGPDVARALPARHRLLERSPRHAHPSPQTSAASCARPC